MKGKSLSHVLLLATSWTAAYQVPPSMGFSRQEYWSGVPLPSLGEGMATHLVSLPGESHGQRSLAGYSPWDCKESDMAEHACVDLCIG